MPYRGFRGEKLSDYLQITSSFFPKNTFGKAITKTNPRYL